MPNLSLLSDAPATHLTAEISISGLELIPAGVAAMVLTALGTALVITALRRREAERDEARQRTLRRAERVDA